MRLGHAVKRLFFGGSQHGIAGTVYGTIVVMGALTAGSHDETDPWRLATIATATVLVLWVAHVYSHALAESIYAGRRLDRAELAIVARHELPIVLAAVGPVVALVLGALGVLRESTAVWLALGIGLATLLVEGVRYAGVEHFGRVATIVAVAVNLSLGLVIVGLKVAIAH
jgi:hypothetical protein